MRQLLLLILPTITLAYIEVDLEGTVRSNVVTSKAYPHGFGERVVTELDRATFGIQNEGLKQAIGKINGKKPDEVYVTNDTPYGDLYERYGWKQVHIKIQPLKEHYFYDFSSSTVVLSKTKYENTNPVSKETLINEKVFLINTLHSYSITLPRIGDVKVSFYYDIDDNSVYIEKTFPFGFYRRSNEDRYYETNATIYLEPGQKVTAEFEALKGIIMVEVPYEISLSGDVVAKYNEMYKDKHFFKFDISDILKANNANETFVTYHALLYEVFYDTQLRIRDTNKTVLKSFPVEKVHAKGLKKATNKHYNNAQGIKMSRKKIEFKVPTDLATQKISDDHNEEESEESEETRELPFPTHHV